jgi:hypothetical protein
VGLKVVLGFCIFMRRIQLGFGRDSPNVQAGTAVFGVFLGIVPFFYTGSLQA